MRRETTLGGDTDALQRFVHGLSRTACHDACGLEHAFPEERLVFELWELTGDETQDDRFVLGKMSQGLESACNVASVTSLTVRKRETE